MARNWTSRVSRRARGIGRALRREPATPWTRDDADARRLRSELDAIRARFPDHA